MSSGMGRLPRRTHRPRAALDEDPLAHQADPDGVRGRFLIYPAADGHQGR